MPDLSIIDLTYATPGFPVEIPLDYGEQGISCELPRMRLMRSLWVELMKEESLLAELNLFSNRARTKSRALSTAISALAAPTGKDSDGNSVGDDGMNLLDVECLVRTSSPFYSDTPGMKRDAWLLLCELREGGTRM
jgi:hypothetical protein